MAAKPKPIAINPDSALRRSLRDASDGDEVRVDTGHEVYVLSVRREPAAHVAPAPEQVARSIAGIRKAAGSWEDVDGEAFKAYIYERRKTANRATDER